MSAWKPSDPRGSLTWRISTSEPSMEPPPTEPQFNNAFYSSQRKLSASSVKESGQQMTLKVMKERRHETASDYKGRFRRWPGVILLMIVILGSSFLITYGAVNTHRAMVQRRKEFENITRNKRKIQDGVANEDGELISDDGQVGNPKKYDNIMKCEMPDYQSRDGQLIAVSKNGTEVVLQIKGVNWFGMETPIALPFGLWENSQNGTTAYEIASFLSRNKFNAVRLPVSVENILNNNAPVVGTINQQSNRAINIKNFITTLQSIVQALGYRNIGVLISMHTLTNKSPGLNWFDESLGVNQDEFLKAVGIVAENLCGEKYWNVMGLDLKNEPAKATWGTGDDTDFVIGSERIAKVMHENCPQWLGFVEGITSSHNLNIDGKDFKYFDWWGGGLQDAKNVEPKFTIENKLVWAPHYYTSAVAPQMYFYGDKTSIDYSEFEELPDEALKGRIDATMYDMFGYLIEKKQHALLLGEFGGLYSKDEHPLKTTKRTTDLTVQILLERGYSGGFMWSLNPESKYEYNPANRKGGFTEGLLNDDWLFPNEEFIQAFEPMNQMPDLKKFPCFERPKDKEK